MSVYRRGQGRVFTAEDQTAWSVCSEMNGRGNCTCFGKSKPCTNVEQVMLAIEAIVREKIKREKSEARRSKGRA